MRQTERQPVAQNDRASYIELVAHVASEGVQLSGLLLYLVDLRFPERQVSRMPVHDLRGRRKRECQVYAMHAMRCIHQRLQPTKMRKPSLTEKSADGNCQAQ